MATYVQNQCPVCRESRHKMIGRLTETASPVPIPENSAIVACRGCRLIYVNPLPCWSAEDFSKLYAADYFTFLETDEHKKWLDIRKNVNPRKRLERVSGHVKALPKKMLEIGAGEYAFMSGFLAANGWDATAQEPGVAFAEKLRAVPGLKVETCDILALDENEKYSLIFADSVLEHVSNPVEYVQKLAGLLSPGGVLYSVSPNEYSMHNFLMNIFAKMKGKNPHYIAPYVQPYHLLGFTKKSLQILGKKCGLELISYKKIDDYMAFHVLNSNRNAIVKYPFALLYSFSRLVGLGTNGEALFVKASH